MADFSMFPKQTSAFGDVPKDIQAPAATGSVFKRVAKEVLSRKDPNNVSVAQVAEEILPTIGGGLAAIPETFFPAVTEFFKTTGGILGEGLAYAVDKNVREQYKAGNLEILPTISNTTQADIAKKTIAAGIETAVYRNIPAAIKGNLATRGGIGALQGLGFAVSEGLANDRTPEEVLESAAALGPFGAVVNMIAPYALPLLKAEMKVVPREIKLALQGLKYEAKGASLKSVQGAQKLVRQVDELFPKGGKKAVTETIEVAAPKKIVAETPELQTFVDEKAAILRTEVPKTIAKVADDVSKPSIENIKIALKKAGKDETLAGSIVSAKNADEFIASQPNSTLKREELASIYDSAIKSTKVAPVAKPAAALKGTWFRGVDTVNKKGGDNFFSSSKEVAGDYGKVSKAKPEDLPQNPLLVSSKEELAEIIGYKGDPLAEPKGMPIAERFDTLAKTYAKKNGHDSILYEEGSLGERELHKFAPEQKPEKGVSTHFEKIKQDLSAAHDSVEYSKINLEDQARQAFDLAENSPEDALKVAYGLKKPPGDLTQQSVQIALIESLKAAGKLDMARALARRVSLAFTKSAQELNIAKLDIGSAGARKIEAIIMSQRLERIGNNIPETLSKGTPKERALKKIKTDAKTAAKEVEEGSKTAYKTAEDLFAALTC